MERTWPFSSGRMEAGTEQRRLRMRPCCFDRPGHAAHRECCAGHLRESRVIREDISAVLLAAVLLASVACKPAEKAPLRPVLLAEDVGIRTLAGFTPLVGNGTELPAFFSDDFSTGEDNQRVVELEISARDAQSQVRVLGLFQIDEIAPAPRGMPRIAITVSVDRSGEVLVIAKHKPSGRTKEAHLGRVTTRQP